MENTDDGTVRYPLAPCVCVCVSERVKRKRLQIIQSVCAFYIPTLSVLNNISNKPKIKQMVLLVKSEAM